MNAAELLERAAARLEDLAGDATRGPWLAAQTTISRHEPSTHGWTISRPWCGKCEGPECPDDCGANVLVTGAEDCDEDYVSEPDATWIAAMHPGVAAPLAAWLRGCAVGARYLDEMGMSPKPDPQEHALEFARLVLGEAEVAA